MVDNEVAALFVSEEGLIEAHPEWWGSRQALEEWTPLLHLPKGVAAGILRLIRERDEARTEIAQLESEIASWREWRPL